MSEILTRLDAQMKKISSVSELLWVHLLTSAFCGSDDPSCDILNRMDLQNKIQDIGVLLAMGPSEDLIFFHHPIPLIGIPISQVADLEACLEGRRHVSL